MCKLKIERGASRVRRVALKTTIDGAVADDIELMCEWSENDTSYIVTELLRFALAHSDDFQAHKQFHALPTVAVDKAEHTAKPDRPKERQAAASATPLALEVAR